MKLPLHRAFAVPTAHVLSSEDGITRVQIEGLICDDVCAARSKQALERIHGVERVAVDFHTGIATVEGRPAPEAAYQHAIDSVAAAKPLRRALAHLRNHR
jgi:copper chaperone CopZ